MQLSMLITLKADNEAETFINNLNGLSTWYGLILLQPF